MTIQKILKNVSGSDLFILSRIVPNASSYVVPAKLWDQLIDDEDILTFVVNGDIIVNDGTTDLSALDGSKLIRRFQEDPDIMQLTGKVFPITFTRNGSVNNKWLECGDGCSTDKTWHVLPFNSKLVATSVSNGNSSADFDIRIHSSNFDNANNDTYITWELPDNTRIASKNNWNNITYSAGTKIGIYCVDNGGNPKTVVFTMWIQIQDDNTFDDNESFGGGF